MNIGLYITVCDNFIQPQQSGLVRALSEQLQRHLSERTYGEIIENISVGFIMVLDRPGYETWYKPKRIRYVEDRTVKSKLTGEMIEKRKLLSWEIGLNEIQLGNFLNGPDNISKQVLLNELVNYLQLVKLPQKVRQFDKNQLITDIQKMAISEEQQS